MGTVWMRHSENLATAPEIDRGRSQTPLRFRGWWQYCRHGCGLDAAFRKYGPHHRKWEGGSANAPYGSEVGGNIVGMVAIGLKTTLGAFVATTPPPIRKPPFRKYGHHHRKW